MTMLQQQQNLHAQEIADLKNSSGPSKQKQTTPWTPTTTITVKQPDTYDGRKTPVELWIFQIKQYFFATGTKDQEQVIYLATNLLRGDATTWWCYHYEQLVTAGTTMPTWDEFEDLLVEKFKPVNAIRVARDKLASLKQTGSVKAYNDLFLGTILEIPTISEEEQLDRYIRGLKEKVHVEVELREPSTLKEVMHIADRYDTISFFYIRCTLYIPRT